MATPAILKTFSRISTVPVDLPYDDELYNLLLNEYGIIHLLYHRNVNQHRVARWWSHLDILRRHIRKILLIMEDIKEVITYRRLTSIQWKSSKHAFIKVNEFPPMIEKKITKKMINKKAITKTQKKKKIQKTIKLHDQLSDSTATNIINKKLSLILKESKYLHKKIIPSSYWVFMGVVELGQFTNIGFTLIGSISRLRELLSKIDGIHSTTQLKPTVIENQSNKGNNTKRKLDELSVESEVDFGEAVNVDELESVIESKENDDKIKNKDVQPAEKVEVEAPISKRQKPNNVMDDIFGSSLPKEKVNIKENDKDKGKKAKKEKKSKKKKAKNAIDDIFGF